MSPLGTPTALWGMQLTTPHLQEISFQVCRGNAAYGLLLANEYLAPNHPLRMALAAKAKLRMASNTGLPEPLVLAIIGGAVASTLKDEWRTIVGPKAIRSERKEIPACAARKKSLSMRTLGRRMALRERSKKRLAIAHRCAAHAAQVISRRCVSIG
jgi:hypothetical protein